MHMEFYNEVRQTFFICKIAIKKMFLVWLFKTDEVINALKGIIGSRMLYILVILIVLSLLLQRNFLILLVRGTLPINVRKTKSKMS